MRFRPAILLVVAVLVAGCGAGIDDTVLPGPREDAIPGQAVFPAPGEDKLQKAQSDPGAPGAGGAPEDIAVAPVCPDPKDKNDPSCTGDDSSAGGTDGTFSDGQ